MIQITTLLATGPIDAPRPAGSIPPLAADFALALGQLLAPATSPLVPGAAMEMPAAGRQMPAAGGKDLPVGVTPFLPCTAGVESILPGREVVPSSVEGAIRQADPTMPAADGETLADQPLSEFVAPARPAPATGRIKAETRIRARTESVNENDTRLAAAAAMPTDLPVPETAEEKPEEGTVAEAKPRERRARRPAPDLPSSSAPVLVEPAVAPALRMTGEVAPAKDQRKTEPQPLGTGKPASSQAPAPHAPTPQSSPEAELRADTPVALSEAVDTPTAPPVPTDKRRPAAAAELPASSVIRLPLTSVPASPRTLQASESPIVLPAEQPAARAAIAPARPVTAGPKPQSAIPASPTAQPAGQAFAAAIFAAERDMPMKRNDGILDSASALPLSGFTAPAQQAPAPVHAAAPVHGAAPLDTRRDDWMGQMIERIEMIRDEGGTREARIRLAPDALGKLDVAIRHDGDAVHVQLTADTQAARTLLADAAPRLAEMAESRGLKLGGSGVDSGNPQAQSDGRDPRQSASPLRPGSAAAAAHDIPETSDERVA